MTSFDRKMRVPEFKKGYAHGLQGEIQPSSTNPSGDSWDDMGAQYWNGYSEGRAVEYLERGYYPDAIFD